METETLKTGTLSTKVPHRVFILNAIQIMGLLTVSLTVKSPETAAFLALLPDPIAGNIGKIGIGMLAAKPALNIIGDFVDNGKLDKSFNALSLLIFLCLFMLPSCGGIALNPPTVDGCFLVSSEVQGRTISAGPCVDDAGKVDRYRAQWRNVAGDEVRSTYIIATKRRNIEYKSPDGAWLKWDSKAGISLDGAPPEAHVLPET